MWTEATIGRYQDAASPVPQAHVYRPGDDVRVLLPAKDGPTTSLSSPKSWKGMMLLLLTVPGGPEAVRECTSGEAPHLAHVFIMHTASEGSLGGHRRGSAAGHDQRAVAGQHV